MADESLNDPGGNFLDDLVTQARDFVFDHLDDFMSFSQETRDWLANPNFESPLADYFMGMGGFSVEEWERMITDIRDISIIEDGQGGIIVEFDFDFESEDGDYSGSRSAKGGV